MGAEIDVQDSTIGVVGIGLMGSSIIASLLVAGHPVTAIAPLPHEEESGYKRILEQLLLCKRFGLIPSSPETYLNRLTVTTEYGKLSGCGLVLECVVEDIDIKEQVYKKITDATGMNSILATNTSAIPISVLQKKIRYPQRFIGIHWAEPAFATRFLEIVCGDQTSEATIDAVTAMAMSWGKESTLLRKDIRGFITNRLMYAVYREILYLVEKGDTNFMDADKSFRYDAGSWITLMGIFRRMDYVGLQEYFASFQRVFPLLSNSDEVSPRMQEVLDINSRGIFNGKGFYKYTQEEADQWAEAFSSFNMDIFYLAADYPEFTEGKKQI